MKAALVQQIRAAVQPAVNVFVDQVVALYAEHVHEAWQDATVAALEALRGALQPVVTPAAPVKKPRKTRKKRPKVVAKAPKAPARKRVAHRDIKPPRPMPTCSKCGEPGHNARTCPLGATLPEALDRQLDVVPLPSKRDRYAELEARVQARKGAA